jgi:hypothetical protein
MSKIKSVSSSGSKQLLTITAQKGQYLSKLVDKDCNVVESYSKCYELNFHELEYSNFHEALRELFERPSSAFLLSAPTGFLVSQMEISKNLQRRILRETTSVDLHPNLTQYLH